MAKVQDDALYILRHMLEHPHLTSFGIEELAAIVALPKPAFDGADLFLLQSWLMPSWLRIRELAWVSSLL